jgi:hypothetical protein
MPTPRVAIAARLCERLCPLFDGCPVIQMAARQFRGCWLNCWAAQPIVGQKISPRIGRPERPNGHHHCRGARDALKLLLVR